jgi:glycosyltransferase involved in cell wall biosynthesis
VSGKQAILIPAYNASATLAATLESIQTQGADALSHIDCVVVTDDGSTDETLSIARATWRDAQPPLVLLSSSVNRGERATCNAAFQRLLDEEVVWCFVLHADDVAKPHWLESLQAIVGDANTRLTSVCSSWDDWLENGGVVPGEDNPFRETEIIAGTSEAACNTLRRGCWWHFSGCAVHLGRFLEVGEFDESMPQLGDLEWLVRCLLSGHDIAYLPRTLIKYRVTGSSVSSASFRTNRDLKEAAYLAEKHGGDQRLAAGMPDFLRARCLHSMRRGAGHMLRGNLSAAWSALGWSLHFASAWLSVRA